MIRSTTPTLIFNVDADLRNCPEISLTFRQHGENVFQLNKTDMEISADQISVVLQQEQSAMLNYAYPVEMQIKALTTDDKVISHLPVVARVGEIFDQRRFPTDG